MVNGKWWIIGVDKVLQISMNVNDCIVACVSSSRRDLAMILHDNETWICSDYA